MNKYTLLLVSLLVFINGTSFADDCKKVGKNEVVSIRGMLEWHPSPHVYEMYNIKPVICAWDCRPNIGNQDMIQLGGKTPPKKYDGKYVTVTGRLNLCEAPGMIYETSVK